MQTFVLPFEAIYLVAARHLPVASASAIVGIYGIGSCLSAIAGGLLADNGLPLSHLLSRWMPWHALAASALLLGLGFGLTALADTLGSLPLYMGSIAIWTLGEIIFVPVSAAIVAAFSPAWCRGTYQGIARTSWGLSACAGPLVGGLVLQQWSAALWIGCAMLGSLVAGGFVLLGLRKGHCQETEEDLSALPQSGAAVPRQATLEKGEEFPEIGDGDDQALQGSSLARAQEMVSSPEMEVYLTKCLEACLYKRKKSSYLKKERKR
jgi:hypothetical protein